MQQEITHIIHQHKGKIYRTCLGFAGNPEDAKDIFQEVCIHLWVGIATFKGQAQLSTWIYRITVNTCLLFIRKNRSKLEVSLETISEPATENTHADESMDTKLHLLRAFIQELPEQDRLLIILSLEGLSYSQISEVTGLSSNHIGVKVNRIKKILTKKFNHHGEFKINLE
ncbi:MAG: sigma-70 family RNA polymerase sigma factor [Bacteroidota bacterium]